jgi:hypothetical protein
MRHTAPCHIRTWCRSSAIRHATPKAREFQARHCLFAIYDRLVDADLPCDQVTVVDGQRNLLGLPQPREETKLLVVAMGQPKFFMRSGDDQFPFLNRKWIDWGPIFLLNPERRYTVSKDVLIVLPSRLWRTRSIVDQLSRSVVQVDRGIDIPRSRMNMTRGFPPRVRWGPQRAFAISSSTSRCRPASASSRPGRGAASAARCK